MNQKQIFEYAIKGITAEIREKESSVRKGYSLLADLEEGKEIKSPMNASEIKEVIRDNQAKIDELDQERYSLEWELSTNKELQ